MHNIPVMVGQRDRYNVSNLFFVGQGTGSFVPAIKSFPFIMLLTKPANNRPFSKVNIRLRLKHEQLVLAV